MPGPFGGINVAQPENVMRPEYSPSFDDVIIRNQEVRSRPAFVPAYIAAPDSARIIALIPSFGAFANLSGPHQLELTAITSLGAYRWDGTNWHTLTSGATPINFFVDKLPLSWRIFQNVVYVTSGDRSISWAGLADNAVVIDPISIAGPFTFGALAIDELDNHLIIANTNENGILTPWRVRWSANGLPTQWDPAVNINAGLADFLEVTDKITGTIMMGRVGYILRTNGVTEISPTGNGIAPFDFNHLWASQVGIGNIMPYSVGLYGSVGAFVADDNIYKITAYNFEPIGGLARDAIMADLGSQTFTDVAFGPGVAGFITPALLGVRASSTGALGGSFDPLPYYTYMLFMRSHGPSPNSDQDTRMWVYHMEDKNWSRWTLKNAWITCRPCYGMLSSTGTQTLLLPVVNPGNATPSIGLFESLSYNDPVQGSAYKYRVEDVELNRYPTVRRVILTYRDLGQATITVTLTGTNDSGTIISKSTNVVIGNVVATGALITKFVDITLSAFRPQLSWVRAANGGPVAITRASILGESEEVTL